MNFKLILLFAASALATASPELQDMHETGVALKLVSHVLNHDVFAITVKRVDDLMDVDKEGKITEIGLKVSQVILTFDVDSTTGALSCNSQPIPYGLSMLKVEADVTTGVKKSALLTMSEDQIKAAFDKGILSIKISASGQKIDLPNGKTIQRILIKEQIVELNGKEVQQSEIIQQVIEVYPGGKVHKGQPVIMPGSHMGQSMENKESHHGKHHVMSNAAHWFKAQSPLMQFAGVIGVGTLLGLLSITLFQLFALIFMSIGYFGRKNKQEDGELGLIDGEKKGFGDVDEEEFTLPGYQSNGYTSVAKNEL